MPVHTILAQNRRSCLSNISAKFQGVMVTTNEQCVQVALASPNGPPSCNKLACLGRSRLAIQADQQLLLPANSPCWRNNLSVPNLLAVGASNMAWTTAGETVVF